MALIHVILGAYPDLRWAGLDRFVFVFVPLDAAQTRPASIATPRRVRRSLGGSGKTEVRRHTDRLADRLSPRSMRPAAGRDLARDHRVDVACACLHSLTNPDPPGDRLGVADATFPPPLHQT